jgi:hypothetical protein
LFLSLVLFCKAQNTEPVFMLKPVLGFNVCQIDGDGASGYHKPGLCGGLMINSRLSKKATFDLSFIYTQKGAWKNQNVKAGDYNFFRINLHYIEIPLLLNYKLNERYFLTLGPSLGYLFKFNVNYNGANINYRYPFNSFEYSANFGLGRRMKGNWLVEVRSNNSFLPILDFGKIVNNTVYFPSPVARFSRKGMYSNILTAYIIYEIHPKKKTGEPTAQ